jgi:hypothetical protein
MAVTKVPPIAQTFSINSNDGAYITAIGIFFQSKAAADDLPVELHIRPAFSGYPDPDKILENSIVFKASNQITTSSTGTAETVFRFDEPVFLEGKKEYAIVMQSNAKEDSYKVWTAKLGDFLAGTTQKRYTKDNTVGVFFRSTNGNTFDPDLTRDLTFKVYRAKFTYDTVKARFDAAPPPKTMLGEDPFVFAAGDATLRVLHKNHGFQVNDLVYLSSDSGGLDSSDTVNGVFGSSILGARTITAIDGTGYTFEMDSSADSSVVGGGDGILATQQYIYDTFKPNLEILSPNSTGFNIRANLTTSKSYAGGETAYAQISDGIISNKEDMNFDVPYVIASDAKNTSLGRASLYFDVYLTSKNDYVQSVVDLQRASVIAIHNIIDNQDSAATTGYNVPLQYVNETDPYLGSALAKHLTVPIVLAEAATGIKVLIDVNRPSGTDFDVYYRTLEAGADASIYDKNWVAASKLEPSSNHNNLPTDTDPRKFREYRYTIGGDYVGTLQPFNTYQIKIVMHSQSSSRVPRFGALRTIALGT